MDGVHQYHHQKPLLQHLTTFQQTPRLDSILEVPDNQPIMETTHTQPKMLSEVNSLILTLVLVNGGKSHSTDNTLLTESESSIEETAVETDSQELKSSLITNTVEQFQEEQETANGTLLNVQSH